MSPRDLGTIFKAYDVRGVVPDQLDEDAARRIGGAFARWSAAPKLAVGRDCRLSSPSLAAALIDGATSVGADVVDLGLTSTDLVYFASGELDLPAVSVTASHNPPEYNGLKLCLSGAAPVGEETGLADVRALAESDGFRDPSAPAGHVEERDLLERFVDHCLGFIDMDAMKPLTVVADTANGMGGL